MGTPWPLVNQHTKFHLVVAAAAQACWK